MNDALKQALAKYFDSCTVICAMGGSEVAIVEAETALSRKFPEPYRSFLLEFGGGIVGPNPIYGIAQAEAMSDDFWSVVVTTRYFREEGWPGTANWIIISMDLGGNPIGLDEQGVVMTYDHDMCEILQLAPDFETYLQLFLTK